MATLGSLVVNVSGNIAPLTKSLAAAKPALKSFGSSVQSIATGATSNLQSLLTGGFLGGLPIIGSLAAINAHFREMKREADQLGVSVKDLQTLKFFGKANFEGLADGMGKFSKILGDAVAGNAEAQKRFRGLGIDFEDLAQKAPTEQIGALADAVKNAETHLAKVHVATQLFGESGGKLVPILNQGAEGLAKSAQQAERMQLATVQLEKMADVFAKIKSEVVLLVAEMIRLGEAAAALDGEEFAFGRDKVSKQGLNQQGQGNQLLRLPGKGEIQANALRMQAEAAQPEIDRIIDQLVEQGNLLSRGPEMWERIKLAEAGATAEQLKQVEGFQSWVKGLEESKRLFESNQQAAGKLFEETRTEAERLRDRLIEIQDLADMGFLDPEVEARAIQQIADQAQEMLPKDLGKPSDKGPEALLAGSAAAVSAINRSSRNGGDPQKQIADGVKKSNEELRALRDQLRQLVQQGRDAPRLVEG